MVRVQNRQAKTEGNLETLAMLDEAGAALEAAGVGRYTHNKQGPCEWWTFWLEGRELGVAYSYTPIPTSWGSRYERGQGTFRCVLSWEETYDFYSSSEQSATVEKGETLTLEQALGILESLLTDELGRAA